MIARLRFARLGPIPASVLAGFLGAGLLDTGVTVLRAPPLSAAPTVLLLAIALYGAAGLVRRRGSDCWRPECWAPLPVAPARWRRIPGWTNP